MAAKHHAQMGGTANPYEKEPLPPLDRDANAFEFFNTPAFYRRKELQMMAAECMMVYPCMIAAGFKEKRVHEVLNEHSRRLLLAESFRRFYIDSTVTNIYYDRFHRMEKRLADEEIVALNGANEIAIINERFVPRLSSYHFKQHTYLTLGQESRAEPICFVFGSKGSGKTFFAVKEAATIRVAEGVEKATLYLSPGALQVQQVPPIPESSMYGSHSTYADLLMQWIKERLYTLYKFEIDSPLNMHLTLVVDNADAENLHGYFASSYNREQLCRQLRKLAVSVRLVICSNFMLSYPGGGGPVPIVFRMKPWMKCDMTKVLQSDIFCSFPHDEIDDISSAIQMHPTLQALSTNPRLALYLLKSISRAGNDLRRMRSSLCWVDELSELAPGLVLTVVANYVDHSELGALSRSECFHLAASVLYAVEVGRNQDMPIAPLFLDLPPVLRRHARALIDLNVKLYGGYCCAYTKGGVSSVVVSPAILTVLLTLLEVPKGVLTSWHSQELVTALHVFCQRVLSIYETYEEALKGIRSEVALRWMDEKKCTEYDLDKSLWTWERRPLLSQEEFAEYEEEISNIPSTRRDVTLELEDELPSVGLVRLVRFIPDVSSSTDFYIPILGDKVTWINGYGAPFADVVGWHTLYRTKQMDTGKMCWWNVPEELWKCGLLKGQDKNCPGRIVLRGLYALWSGEVTHTKSETDNSTILDRSTLGQQRRLQQRSKAYPMNILTHPRRQESTQFSHVTKTASGWKLHNGVDYVDLPELPDEVRLTLTFSTDADTVELNLDIDAFLFSKEPMHPSPAKDEWETTKSLDGTELRGPRTRGRGREMDAPVLPFEFLEGVLDGVEIKFLIT